MAWTPPDPVVSPTAPWQPPDAPLASDNAPIPPPIFTGPEVTVTPAGGRVEQPTPEPQPAPEPNASTLFYDRPPTEAPSGQLIPDPGSPDFATLAGRGALTVGQNIQEVPGQLIRGAVEGVNQIGQSVNDFAQWAWEREPDWVRRFSLFGLAGYPNVQPKDVGAVQLPVPFAPPTTPVGSMAEFAGQFTPAYTALVGNPQGVGLAVGFMRRTLASFVAGATTQAPDAQRLSNVIDSVAPNFLTRWLKADPKEEDQMVARLKSGLEYAGLNAVAEGVIATLRAGKNQIAQFAAAHKSTSHATAEDIAKAPIEVPPRESAAPAAKEAAAAPAPPAAETAKPAPEAVAPTTAEPPPIPPRPQPAVLPPPLSEPRITAPMNDKIASAFEDLLKTGNVARAPNMRITHQAADLLATGRLTNEDLIAVMDKHGITPQEFAGAMLEDTSAAGKLLNRWSYAQRRIMAGAMQGEDQQAWADALGKEAVGIDAPSFWKRLNNARRGALILQPAVAIRNAETQGIQIGLDGMVNMIDETLRVARGLDPVQSLHPANLFAEQLRLLTAPRAMMAEAAKGRVGSETLGQAAARFWQARGVNAKLADDILAAFPVEQDRMFSRYFSDLITVAKNRPNPGVFSRGLSQIESAVKFGNGLNQGQEFFFRRAVMLGVLDQEAKRLGLAPLERLAADRLLHTIPRELITKAVDRSMEATFAEEFGGMTAKIIQVVNGTPLSLPLPFPRWIVQSAKIAIDYNPTGFLKLLTPSEMAKVAAGDHRLIGKAITGTALLYAGYRIRSDPSLAGEHWYEIRYGDRTIDMRPFGPFAMYLFLGDVIARLQNGTLGKMTPADWANGVLSSSFRAGVGLYLFDQMVNVLQGTTDWEKVKRMAEGLAGETLSQPFVFMQAFRDAFAQFDQKERVLKDTSSEPFWGPFLRKLPYGTSGLPPALSYTSSEPIVTQAPFLRQATGIILRQPKNLAEKELDRLGFQRHDYAPSYGDPAADRLVAKYMGPVVEKLVAPALTSPAYQNANDQAKAFMLSRMMHEAHQMAVGQAIRKNRQLFAHLALKRVPNLKRQFIESIIHRSLPDLVPAPAPQQ